MQNFQFCLIRQRKKREENLIKEESKKEISLYKYNRESKNGNAGEKIFSMSEGQQKWLYQGQEMQADTAPEIRNGIMYLPLRDMAKVFGFDELTWDSSTQTVRLFRSSY